MLDHKNVLQVDGMSIAKNSIYVCVCVCVKETTDFGQDLLNTIFNVYINLCNAFLEFRVHRRNITDRCMDNWNCYVKTFITHNLRILFHKAHL